jgi:hypothetical protein
MAWGWAVVSLKMSTSPLTIAADIAAGHARRVVEAFDGHVPVEIADEALSDLLQQVASSRPARANLVMAAAMAAVSQAVFHAVIGAPPHFREAA